MTSERTIAEINNAIGAHGAWKLRLTTAIATGRFESDAASVACDDKCAFGQWIHGTTIDERTRTGMPYHVVKRLHAEFHQCAAHVVAHAVSGRPTQARELLNGDYTQRSDKLMRALSKWKGELRSGGAAR
jgi:hypothetical protein